MKTREYREEQIEFAQKFLRFAKVVGDIPIIDGQEGKLNFTVRNKDGDMLGYINFYPKWKKYVYTSYGETILDSLCLKGLVKFISFVSSEDETHT